MILRLAPELPLETQLGCFGYFGFGSGVALALLGPSSDGGPLYCQAEKCAKASACWVRHRARVKVLLPGLVELSEEVAKTHRGADYMKEFQRRVLEEWPDWKPDRVAEPFVTIMMGNMEDGAHVATSGHAKDRGDGTLTWPLTPLEP